VPFVRASRDKRGYEHFFLVQNGADYRGKGRPSVLYWFRTPPNVKVGREPFDDSAARALEAQHPDLTFDWKALRNTPVPTVQPEYWRERRRAQRAERRLREADERESDAAVVVDEEPGVEETVALAEGTVGPDVQPVAESFTAVNPGVNAAATPPSGDTSAGHRRHRRRRRRGGRHRANHSTADSRPAQTAAPAPSSSSLGDPTFQTEGWRGSHGDHEGE
jgi:hypothetical protein